MWYYDVVPAGRNRPDHLGPFQDQATCQAAVDAHVADPANSGDVSVSPPFQGDGNFPVPQFNITMGDGSVALRWSDGYVGPE